MDDIKRALPVILAHLFIGLIACITYAVFFAPDTILIAPLANAYRLRTGFLFFIQFMPAFMTGGMLTGYALAFSRNADKAVERWSPILLSYIRGAFVLSLVLVSIYVVCSEGIRPYLVSSQDQARERNDDYHDFISVAKDALTEAHPYDAALNIDAASGIWKSSPEVAALRERMLYMQAELSGNVYSATTHAAPSSAPGTPPVKKGSRNIQDFLELSAASELNRDFYSAHYYAMQAALLAPSDDPRREMALGAASRVWNKILEGNAVTLSEPDRMLFQTKHEGYVAIEQGDFLRAYYIFLGLAETDAAAADGKHDPDIARLLAIARTGLLTKSFFIDETANLRLFESARDVFFLLPREDGSRDAILVRGVTWSRSGGRNVAYLRNLEIAHFSPDSKRVYQTMVPYAKMFPYTDAAGMTRPEILMHSVDRNKEGSDRIPEILAGEVPELESTSILLSMPYHDFELLISASRGADSMPMIDLMNFSGKAETYGYSSSPYLRNIIARLADPFLVLILSVYMLILGWKYRLGKNVLFKAWWILAVPLLPIVALFAMEILRYLSRLAIAVIVTTAPAFALPLTLGTLTAVFIAVSVIFFSQRSE